MGLPENIADIKFIPVREKYDYYSLPNKKIKYYGYAESGKSSSQPVWKINLFLYDGDWDITDTLVAYGAWDDRDSLDYKNV